MSYSLATLDTLSKKSRSQFQSSENGQMLCDHSANEIPQDNQSPLAPPPIYTQATFGVMGIVGIVISIVTFIMDIVADVLLSVSLGNRYMQSGESEHRSWFIITVFIIIIPAAVINAFSLWWYSQNKECLGHYRIFYRMTKTQILIRIIMHLLLLGQLIRFIDMYRYGRKMQKEVRYLKVGTGGSVKRRTPKGESYAVLQMVISRDTAMLDMMHSFLQDSPQLVFQIFLLYRSPVIIMGQDTQGLATILSQLWKILVAVFSISWSMVSYQDELRRSVANKTQLTCGGTIACLVWRASLVLARVTVIASFAAIEMEDSHHKFWTYPVITALVLTIHWLIMIVWIHAQKTNFCIDIQNVENEPSNSMKPKEHPILEFLYNIVMGWVHIFSYLNLKDTPSRRRMVFYYSIIFLENTILMAIWFMQVGTVGPEVNTILTELWFRILMISLIELLFTIGISCMLGYYGFLHPDRHATPEINHQPSWRR